MNKDNLTVLVFKDNSVARTFRVPLAWISKIGLLSGAIAATALISLFLSVRFYVTSRQLSRAADPGYVHELEQENGTLKASLKKAETKSAEMATLPIAAQPINASPAPTGTTSSMGSALTSIVPGSTATEPLSQIPPSPTAAANPADSTATVSAGQPLPVGANSVAAGSVFTTLPTVISSTVTPDSPIAVFEPKIKWVGKTLKVQFFIQYTKEDKGNQQGRIVLLARGGETILAYPAGVLNTEDGKPLIEPSKGEYFSVSRIREVKADFGPVRTGKDLANVEVFLIGSQDNKLLVHQFLTPGQQ